MWRYIDLIITLKDEASSSGDSRELFIKDQEESISEGLYTSKIKIDSNKITHIWQYILYMF